MDFEIKNVCADYSHSYNPATCHDGGGYWQYHGTCDVILENGVVIYAKFDDSSCGDFGRRFGMDLIIDDEELHIWENHVGTTDEEMDKQYNLNEVALVRLEELVDTESDYIVSAVAEAIANMAYDRYRAEH